eukprot:1995699-Amphidinium_carterae.1
MLDFFICSFGSIFKFFGVWGVQGSEVYNASKTWGNPRHPSLLSLEADATFPRVQSSSGSEVQTRITKPRTSYHSKMITDRLKIPCVQKALHYQVKV